MSAILRGRQGLEIARLLLQAGVNPNCKDEEGRTPLKIVSQAIDDDDPYALPLAEEFAALLKEFGGACGRAKPEEKGGQK